MDAQQAHGSRGSSSWPLPTMVTRCDAPNRADQGNHTASHEYTDTPAVFAAKVKLVAELLTSARHVCAYTGAGLSKASGIPDYATKNVEKSVVNAPKLKSSLDALPTYAHHCLVTMHKHSMLHSWVQQNHDGLPQKAGFPQSGVNEIHGAWFDPSNPVVPFSANLRHDLFQDMLRLEQTTDLCLCLGTSLSGMNADRMANTPAKKSLMSPPQALGTVIVNLQQTPLDKSSSVRIWGKLDDFFQLLMKELSLTVNTTIHVPKLLKAPYVFTVPYNEEGLFDPTCRMTLDLSRGAAVKIAPKHAPNYNATGTVRHTPVEHGGTFVVEVDKVRTLGAWWATEAVLGQVPYLPVINVKPTIRRLTAAEQQNDPLVQATNAKYDLGVAQLVDMGFDTARALDALSATNGDVLAATALLTGEAMDEE